MRRHPGGRLLPEWPLLRYEARAAFGAASLLPALLLPAYALLQWFFWSRGLAAPNVAFITRSFELLLPLAAGLGAAHPLAVEREVGLSGLRATYPEPAWRTPLLRVAGVLLLTLASALAAAGIYRAGAGPFRPQEIMLPGAAPALYLMGLSLLVSRLSGSYWAAAGTALGYWAMEVIRRGQETGILFLFQRTWPLADVNYGWNRWLLAGLGIALAAAAAWDAARRRS